MKSLVQLLFNAPRFFKRQRQTILNPRVTSVVGAVTFGLFVQALALACLSAWVFFLSWVVFDRLSDLWRIGTDILGMQSPLVGEVSEFLRRFGFHLVSGEFFSRKLILLSFLGLGFLRLLFLTVFAHMGIKLWSKQRVSVFSTLITVSVSEAPLLFSVIPFFGSGLGVFLCALCAAYGVAIVGGLNFWQGCVVLGLTYALSFVFFFGALMAGFLKLYAHLQLFV